MECGHRYVRREHLRLFLSFFLLLSPALEGDSSFSLAWLDILEEFCWLKWLGTWRAKPPWEAKLALQPPTTHWQNATNNHPNHQNLIFTAMATEKKKTGDFFTVHNDVIIYDKVVIEC